MQKILFVCLGNICRSPTAHGVFEAKVANGRMAENILVDSCGTGDWHIGHPPDERAQRAAKTAGYDLSTLRARQFTSGDLKSFDWVFAMDRNNLRDIDNGRTASSTAETRLFLEYAFEELQDSDNEQWHTQYNFAKAHSFEVPDPYYGGASGFKDVIDVIEVASDLILRRLAGL